MHMNTSNEHKDEKNCFDLCAVLMHPNGFYDTTDAFLCVLIWAHVSMQCQQKYTQQNANANNKILHF